jgi:16S rRNA (uracil1498-N3)-methyltransferase
LEYPSNIELYYSPLVNSGDNVIELTGDEFHHAIKVMRNREGGEIHITNGNGIIFICTIAEIFKDYLKTNIKKQIKFENRFSNITFCLPVLKNPDRFKFALEKCTELGITNFILFNSSRSIVKIKNVDKWDKTILSAMKQSLRAYLPVITNIDNVKDLLNFDGEKFIFDQNTNEQFEYSLIKNKKYFFIFGPEGGFSNEELSLFNTVYKLADNRLRTETAIIKCVSIIS